MSTKAFKSEKISQMKEKIEKAKVAIVTDYKGLSVEEITKLRRLIQKEDADYMVTKNTLAKIAIKGTEYEVLADSLTGPVVIAFGFDDQVAPAKVLAEFISANPEQPGIEIKAGFVEGKVVDLSEIIALSKVPSKETLLTMLACGLNANIANLARAINAVKEQREAAEA